MCAGFAVLWRCLTSLSASIDEKASADQRETETDGVSAIIITYPQRIMSFGDKRVRKSGIHNKERNALCLNIHPSLSAV